MVKSDLVTSSDGTIRFLFFSVAISQSMTHKKYTVFGRQFTRNHLIQLFPAIKNLSEDLKLLMNAIMAQAEEKISFLMPS